MSNTQHLKDILSKYDDLIDTTEAMEFIDAIEDELIDKDDKIKLLKDEVDVLEDNETEEVDLESYDLGLDVIEFRFEKGNLAIRQQFDKMMQHLNKTPNAILY